MSNPNNYYFSTQDLSVTQEALRRADLIIHEADLEWERYHARMAYSSYAGEYKTQNVEERMQDIIKFRMQEMAKKPEERTVTFSEKELNLSKPVPISYFLNRSKN
jgi:hypothetical protein